MKPRTGQLVRRRPTQPPRKPVEEDRNANHIQVLEDRHKGADVYVVGMGTSLLGFDWSRLNDKVTIALNEAVKQPGFVTTYHLFSDSNLFQRPKDVVRRSKVGGYGWYPYDPRTSIVCQGQVRRNFLEKSPQTVQTKRKIFQFAISSNLSQIKLEDDYLFIVATVATGAIMLALKMGARRIFLLGVDGYKIREGHGGTGKEVYYADGSTKPPERRKECDVQQLDGFVRVVQDRHNNWIKQMKELRAWLSKRKLMADPWPGANVYQTSQHSPIECWQKISIDDALNPPV